MRTVILSSSNIVGTGNNVLTYDIPTTATFRDDYVAVASVSMYYSWFNISAALGNNTFTYTWDQAGSPTSITIPPGLYEVSTLNAFLQSEFIRLGHYMVQISTAQNVYFAEFVINPAQYVVQINTYSIPIASAPPVGYTIVAALPAAQNTMGMTLGSGLGALLGYTGGNLTIAPVAGLADFVQRSFQSNVSPNIQPNSTVLISVDGVDNPYASPTGVIYAFSPSVGVGEIVIEKPPQLCWVKIREGQYRQLTVRLLGSANNTPLPIKDPAMTIILAIADEQEALGFQTVKRFQ
jgi:hypothetical protein